MRIAFGARLALIAIGLIYGSVGRAQESASVWNGLSPSLLPQATPSNQGFSQKPLAASSFSTQNQASIPQPVPSNWEATRYTPQGTGVPSGIPKIRGLNSASPVPRSSPAFVGDTAETPQRYPLPERVPQLSAPAFPLAQSVGYPGEPKLSIPSPPPAPSSKPSRPSIPALQPKGSVETRAPGLAGPTSTKSYFEQNATQGDVVENQEADEALDTYFEEFDAGCQPCGKPIWFGGAYGLVMMRDYESVVPLSYDPSNPRATTLSSDDSEFTAMGGIEATFGRHYANGLGWQVSYWGLYPGEQSWWIDGFPDSQMSGLSNVDYAATGFGTNDGLSWFDDGVAHMVCRENEIHNVELNLLSFLPLCPPTCNPCFDDCSDNCGPRYTVSMFGGLRYFTFEEFFGYRSTVEGSFTNDPRDLYHDLNVDNHLFGLQWGSNFNFCLCRNLTLTGGTKVGAFANYIEHWQKLHGPSGYATINNGPYSGRDYDFESDKTDVAMLGELSVGLAYQFAKNWRVTGGYRAMGISGVALAPNQIPANYWSQSEAENINSEGSLILHGAYFGVEFAY